LNHKHIIIGAGVSGLSAALRLLQRDCHVTLLDRCAVGGESSWAGGGVLSPLLPWDYTEPVSALALRSMAAYAAWVADIEATSKLDAELWRCGMLALDVASPQQALAWCATHGMVALRDCPDALNTLGGGNPIWLPGVAQVRNPRLVAALRAAVVQLGGVIHEHCPAVGVVALNRRVTAVQTATKTFPADNVVLATGAWSGLGLAELAATPKIRPIRGQMLLFKLEPGALDTILYRNGLYLIPRRDGHVLVGSTVEDAGFDKSTDATTLQHLHAEAAKMLPILSTMQPIRHWAGLRPGSPGNIPVIGPHPDFDNVFINTGHYRYGVTMAPASAALLLDLMEGNTPELDPTPYSWQAALARTWTDAL